MAEPDALLGLIDLEPAINEYKDACEHESGHAIVYERKGDHVIKAESKPLRDGKTVVDECSDSLAGSGRRRPGSFDVRFTADRCRLEA
jgi:hypothetical protein